MSDEEKLKEKIEELEEELEEAKSEKDITLLTKRLDTAEKSLERLGGARTADNKSDYNRRVGEENADECCPECGGDMTEIERNIYKCNECGERFEDV